jgi:hypothetical protein
MKPVDEESNTTPVFMSRTKRIIFLVIFLLICGGLSWAAINLHSSPRAEEPLSDVKALGIESVEQMPYVQGEHKQEILKQINEAGNKWEVQRIVGQAQKDNDEIRVLVAAHRLESHDCENGGNK